MAKGVAVPETEITEVEEFRPLKTMARQDALLGSQSLGELKEVFGALTDWEDIEPRFDVIKDKSTFEGKPLIIGAFRFNVSTKFTKAVTDEATGEVVQQPAEFVSLMVAEFDPESESLTSPWKIVNDGGTGIKEQLIRYAGRYGNEPLLCPPVRLNNGLRKSEYPFEESDGSMSTATTWYLS